LVGKHEGKRPLRRPKCRGKNTIKMGLIDRIRRYELDISGTG
jgi:hypothetical protein